MKKTRLTIACVICLLVFCLTGCSKAEYYENISLEELESFTSITGITVNSVEEGIDYVKYEYILTGAEGHPLDEYMLYLHDEYGCELSVEESAGLTLVYRYGEEKISMTKVEESFGDVAYITLPLTAETIENNKATSYEELKSLIESGNYQQAEKHELSSDYKDVKALKMYAKGMSVMNMLPSQGCAVDTTIKYFEQAEGVYDSEKQKDILLDYVKHLNGSYKTTSRGYEYYMYIKDGAVATSFSDEKDAILYSWELYIWPTSSGDVLYAVGQGHKNYYENAEYRCTMMDNGEILVYDVQDYEVASGTYKLIRSKTPDKK